MEKELMNYIDFKLSQAMRINGISARSENAKEKLYKILNENKNQWVQEYLASVA